LTSARNLVDSQLEKGCKVFFATVLLQLKNGGTMNWSDRLYFGTWQFGEQAKNLSSSRIVELLNFAIGLGVCRFDTAVAYGDGQVETILGKHLPQEAVVLTKIPARHKPVLNQRERIQDCYPSGLIRRRAEGSLKRLGRDTIDIVLLHNWHPSWLCDAAETLAELTTLREARVARRVGISLPNGFNSPIDETIMSQIDVVEAPYNSQERWVLKDLPRLLSTNKEVLLRSLFCGGKILTENSLAREVMQKALALNTSVVIGMTAEEQITENVSCIQGES